MILTMRALFEFTVHLLVTVFTLLKPGGVKAMASENLILRQQLIVVQRTRKRAPNLKTSDRFIKTASSISEEKISSTLFQ